jgi:hypothetical protein
MPTVEELLGMASKANYLNCDSVGDGMFLTIAGLRIKDISAPGADDTEAKPVVYFEEDDRGWIMNVTSLTILRAMFGSDTDGWVGKRLTLYNDKSVRVARKNKPDHVGAIRIRSSPDIASSFKIKAGGNAYRKATEYVIKKVTVVDPLAEALTAHGLTTKQYDVWAAANQRPPFVESGRATREKAADWIKRGGHAAILRAQPKPATEPEPTPEPTPSAE